MTIAIPIPSPKRLSLPSHQTHYHSPTLAAQTPASKLARLKTGFEHFGKWMHSWSLEKRKRKEQPFTRRPGLSSRSSFAHTTCATMGDGHHISSDRIKSSIFASDSLFGKYSHHRRPPNPTSTLDIDTCSSLSPWDDAFSVDSPVRIVCMQDTDRKYRPGILVKPASVDHSHVPWTDTPHLTPQHSPTTDTTKHVWHTLNIKSDSTDSHSSGSRQYRSSTSFRSSSNVTINSEDLTAKEFADLTGIKIIPENDDDMSNHNENEDHEDIVKYSTVHSTIDPGEVKYVACTSVLTPTLESNSDQMTVHTLPFKSSPGIYSYHEESDSSFRDNGSMPKPNIWDKEFWREPETNRLSHVTCCSLMPDMNSTVTFISEEEHQQHRQPASPGSSSHQDGAGPMIQQETRRIQNEAIHDDPANRNNYTIRKGRFEIHWELGSV